MTDASRPVPDSAPQSKTPQKSAEEHAPVVNPFMYRLVVAATYLPVIFTDMHLEIHGRENIPAPGTPLVVAANHVSGIDPFLVAKALPPGRYLQFMAKKELFKPVIGWIIRTGGSFPVDREGNDVGAVRTAVRILKENGTVGIFPQGHRGGQEMQGGVALIAAKGRAPILPVGISRDGKRWIVRFGQPIQAKGIKATTEELDRVLKELAHPVGTKL